MLRKKLLWPLLAAGWALLSALVLAPNSYRYLTQSSRPLHETAESMKRQLLARPATGELDLGAPEFTERPPELQFPVHLLPRADASPLFRDLEKPDCDRVASLATKDWKRDEEKKALAWLEYRCGRKALDAKFFERPPHHHPQGGSWAWFAARTSPDFAKREWLVDQAKRLHIVEAAKLLGNDFPIGAQLANLSLMDLGVMLNGQPIVVGENNAYVADIKSPRHFFVHPLSQWREIERASPLKLISNDPQNCAINELFSCWTMNSAYFWRGRISIAALSILTAALLLGFFYKLVRERRLIEVQAAADRQLLVQTLAHELRHPATGLRLSLETFRDQFDSLSDGLKEEFLRMTGQMQRLQRLIHASQQYLQTDTTDGPFKFRKIRIESFNDYFEDLLENFRGKIEIVPLEKDRAIAADAYWLGMCVTNLIRNALVHGDKPIRARATASEGKLAIEVSDGGRGIPENEISRRLSGRPQESTDERGMGLGLSLVVRIARLMGGDLSYSRSPRSTFTLTLEATDEIHSDRRG